MSRIGKKPIPLPSGVKVQIGTQLEVTGPKGKLAVPIPSGISVQQKLSRARKDRRSYGTLCVGADIVDSCST